MAVGGVVKFFSYILYVVLGFTFIEMWQPEIDSIVRERELTALKNAFIERNKIIATVAMGLGVSASLIIMNVYKALKEKEEYIYWKKQNEDSKKHTKPFGSDDTDKDS